MMLLVGNKSDLSELRVVSHEQGYSYATSVGALFCETSAAFQKGDDLNPSYNADRYMPRSPTTTTRTRISNNNRLLITNNP